MEIFIITAASYLLLSYDCVDFPKILGGRSFHHHKMKGEQIPIFHALIINIFIVMLIVIGGFENFSKLHSYWEPNIKIKLFSPFGRS